MTLPCGFAGSVFLSEIDGCSSFGCYTIDGIAVGGCDAQLIPLRIFRNCLRHPWIRILDLHRAQFRVPTNIAVLPTGSMHPEPIAVTHKGPDGSGKDPSAPAVPGDLLRQFEFTLDLTGRRIVVYR